MPLSKRALDSSSHSSRCFRYSRSASCCVWVSWALAGVNSGGVAGESTVSSPVSGTLLGTGSGALGCITCHPRLTCGALPSCVRRLKGHILLSSTPLYTKFCGMSQMPMGFCFEAGRGVATSINPVQGADKFPDLLAQRQHTPSGNRDHHNGNNGEELGPGKAESHSADGLPTRVALPDESNGGRQNIAETFTCPWRSRGKPLPSFGGLAQRSQARAYSFSSGSGMCLIRSSTMRSVVTPSASALKLVKRRWRRTGRAIT